METVTIIIEHVYCCIQDGVGRDSDHIEHVYCCIQGDSDHIEHVYCCTQGGMERQ